MPSRTGVAILGSTPRWCRPEAFERFRAALPRLETWDGLVEGAVALSAHALGDNADLSQIEAALDHLAGPILHPVGRSLTARIAHLHQRLFDELGFVGNRVDYYAAENSYLSHVLSSRRGIPISLGLVYGAVAARAGISVEGVGAPGHFLLRTSDESGAFLVDAFHGGRMLDDDQAHALMEMHLGTRVPHDGALLQPVTHRAWLDRMLRNLTQVFRGRAMPRDAEAMRELQILLHA